MKPSLGRTSDRIGLALILAGILPLLYAASVWLQAESYQARQKRLFEESLADLQVNHAAATAVSTAPEMNAVIGRLDIPSVHVSVMVLEGVEDAQLQMGAGHVPETALPGERGNVGIAGHRDTFFRPLREIQKGDVITLRTIEGIFRYRVESTWITEPDDVAVLESGSKSTLTLVTCHPFSYIGPAPDRFIVRAVSLEEE